MAITLNIDSSSATASASEGSRRLRSGFRSKEYGKHSDILINGIRLHYVEKGDPKNPLMIFLHGFPELWWYWRHQITYFAKSYWVVAVDMPGFGDSEKPAGKSNYDYGKLQDHIVELVRGLGRKSTILVAHDWGGFISWGVAANYPDIVSKLIVLNAPHPNLWLRCSRHSSIFQWLRSWYILPFLVPCLSEVAFSFGLRAMRPAVFKVPGVSYIAPKFNAEELSAFKSAFPGISSWFAPLHYYRNFVTRTFKNAMKRRDQDLPKMNVPTLIIWGKREVYLDSATPEKCRQYVKDLKVEYLEDAGHFLLSTHSKEINKLIESFLHAR